MKTEQNKRKGGMPLLSKHCRIIPPVEVYYGLTNYSQLKNMPDNINVMVSARFLIRCSDHSKAFDYLKRYKKVFLDSGAFGCAMYDGGFTYTPEEYANLVQRIKPTVWATMDVPCEPDIMPELSTYARICRTTENTKILARYKIPGFLPVIQGWEIEDYLFCVDRMEKENLILPYMGIGSLCRRGSQAQIVAIISELRNRLPGIKLHAFGTKINALTYNHGELLNYLYSLDTAAWQFKMERCVERRPKRRSDYPLLFQEYSVALNKKISSPYQLVLKGTL